MKRKYAFSHVPAVSNDFLILKHQNAKCQRKILQDSLGAEYAEEHAGQKKGVLDQIEKAVRAKYQKCEFYRQHAEFINTKLFPQLKKVCQLQGRDLRNDFQVARNSTSILIHTSRDATAEEMRNCIMYTTRSHAHTNRHSENTHHNTRQACLLARRVFRHHHHHYYYYYYYYY